MVGMEGIVAVMDNEEDPYCAGNGCFYCFGQSMSLKPATDGIGGNALVTVRAASEKVDHVDLHDGDDCGGPRERHSMASRPLKWESGMHRLEQRKSSLSRDMDSRWGQHHRLHRQSNCQNHRDHPEGRQIPHRPHCRWILCPLWIVTWFP